MMMDSMLPGMTEYSLIDRQKRPVPNCSGDGVIVIGGFRCKSENL